ncbi:MAG: ankyrin repeat domain-containing protein [Armatimonadetes bacterium]|nr:ankyrin repeat domain-containing protein [Armatimonadota bacterium]
MALLRHDPALIRSRDEGRYTPLFWAAAEGDVDVVRWLLRHGADVNATGGNKFTPLHVTQSPAVVRLLIRAGANTRLIDAWGKTPLQAVAEMKRVAAARAMLAEGCRLDLTSALWLGMRDRARHMILADPVCTRQVIQGPDLWENTSPLGIAAGQGDAAMVRLLLKAGAPVNSATEIPNEGDATPLFNAVVDGHADVVEILCRAGADPNVEFQNPLFHSLLDCARKASSDPARGRAYRRIAVILIRYGAR